MKNKLAPIVLFVYNRPRHTKRTIEALQKNMYAEESELFVYCDEAKDESLQKSVDEVRSYIDSINGFKKITVINREENWGLAKSIINGVTTVVNNYGKVIVLEDDLVTSPYFLKFMNEALNFYDKERKVWHISGWNYPIQNNDLDDVFLWKTMNCWGWATWSDRWKYFEKDADKTMKNFTIKDIKEFNLNGKENFFEQVILNHKKKIDTWAIFWYITIFKKAGFCLNPSQTFVENIGHDGSGVNCGESEVFQSSLSLNNNINFINNINENKEILKRIQNFYKLRNKSFLVRIINKLSRIIFGKNIIK